MEKMNVSRGMFLHQLSAGAAVSAANPLELSAQREADCILYDRETPVPGELGRRDLVILEGIYKAAATGSRVTIAHT